MVRTFVAVEIPRFDDLDRLLAKLKSSGSKISVPRPEGIHVTLKFLGEVEEERLQEVLGAVKKVSTEFAPFDAKVVGTGAFPDERKPRVLWIGIEDGGALARLADAVDDSMSRIGFPREGRKFTPHVTVARVKSLSGIDMALGALQEFEHKEFGSIRVRDVRLKKSTLMPTGSIYEDLGVFDLTGGSASPG